MMILGMNLKVLVELVDTAGKYGYLNFRRTGVAFMSGILKNDICFFLCCHIFHLF